MLSTILGQLVRTKSINAFLVLEHAVTPASLDRSNLNNAYISGMKEDLHMSGNQLNQINTVFWCAYFVGQIPNNLAMQYLRPRLWMTFCMVGWGLCTLGTAFVGHWKQIMVIRFFQSLFEGSTFVGTHYVLGSWYKDEELGKRTGIFTSSGLAGTLFSGVLQGGIYGSLSKITIS
jgi:MFS transporter, ACS family, pantothenate transporter